MPPLPPDLEGKPTPIPGIREVPGGLTTERNRPPSYTGSAISLHRSLIGTRIIVGLTPVLLIKDTQTWPYLITNPAITNELTNIYTAVPVTTATVSGNSKNSPLDVAGFEQAHIFINVTSVGGIWDFYLMTQDQLSGVWLESQRLFARVREESLYYGYTNLGIVSKLAFKWHHTGKSGTLIFSINVSLKTGLGGNPAAVSKVVYLGGPEVNIYSGYPLLEKQEKILIMDANVELWAIANQAGLEVRTFRL